MNCVVGKGLMVTMEDCLILNNCGHIFHRMCIENSLFQAAQCPECQKSCELAELNKINAQNCSKLNHGAKTVSGVNVRGRARGGVSKKNITRNVMRNLFQDGSLLDVGQLAPQIKDNFTPRPACQAFVGDFANIQRGTYSMNGNQGSNVPLDSYRLTHIIETSIGRILENFNIYPNVTQNTDHQIPNNPPSTCFQVPHNIPNTSCPPLLAQNNGNFNVRSDKITSIKIRI